MAFGQGEAIGTVERKFYTGVDNFNVTAVSPSKEELEALWGREIQFTPEYTGLTKVSDADGEREVAQVRIDFYLDNSSDDNSITTKASFYVANTHHKSSTGKLKVINQYGEDSWLAEEHIKAGTLPENMRWYDNAGVKVAKRGEVELIDFLKNLLNIAFNNAKTVNKADAEAFVTPEQWAAIFKGDFTVIRELVASTNNKVGLALGVKTASDNTMKQTVYTRKALRQYTLHSTRDDRFKWILKDITEAQAGGAMPQVDFGPEDFSLRQFKLAPTQLSLDNMPSNDDVFAGNAASTEADDLAF